MAAPEPLGWLALARGTLDRAGLRRSDDAWLADTWTDPRTKVVVAWRGRTLVRHEDTPGGRRGERSNTAAKANGTSPTLVLLDTERAPDGERYLLGVDPEGVAYFAVSAPLPAIDGAEPADLRMCGATLSDRDAGLFTLAAALQNWHATHAFCPRCGARTTPASAGHVRICEAEGTEHFPRTDPAVIMVVHDDERILLASGARWPERRVSILAGFVEPGESLEQAVAREVREEVGVLVGDCQYLGSQPWPLPRSLMLGFFARADGRQEPHVDGEEIKIARWYTRPELRAAAESGEIRLPGRVSIARQLIERWHGEPLPGDW